MTFIARRSIADMALAPNRRRRPVVVPRLEPRSHVVVLPAGPAAAAIASGLFGQASGLAGRAITARAAAELSARRDLAEAAHSPITRPPCRRLGAHFPTATGSCFYGCEDH